MDSPTWTDVVPHGLVLVPLGSYEQHGPHLPLHTDTTIAAAVARGVAERVTGPAVHLAAPVAYGASGEHQDFPGTVSIGAEALRAVLVELVRSVAHWADRVVFVNGHGGNVAAVRQAVRQLRVEGHDVGWVPCAVPDGDAHAGFTETSVLLHLMPDQVAMARGVPGDRRPLAELMPALVKGGIGAVSPTGILGDPSGASAEAGERILAAMVDAATGWVTAWCPDADGHLSTAVVA